MVCSNEVTTWISYDWYVEIFECIDYIFAEAVLV
jgi:hypothetical protein